MMARQTRLLRMMARQARLLRAIKNYVKQLARDSEYKIKEMKDRISSLEAQLAAAVNLFNNQAATNQV